VTVRVSYGEQVQNHEIFEQMLDVVVAESLDVVLVAVQKLGRIAPILDRKLANFGRQHFGKTLLLGRTFGVAAVAEMH
jgi:hypothetical protein